MPRFTRQKLASEPAGVVRWRSKKVDHHVVNIAIHPGEKGPKGGVTTATSLLHPKGERRGATGRSLAGRARLGRR